MSARERILSRLRAAPAPFSDVAPIAERRQMIPPQKTASEGLSQFIDNARSLGCFVYQVDRSEAVEQIMDLLDGDNSLLSWDEAHLPLDGAHGLLNSLGVAVARQDDGGVARRPYRCERGAGGDRQPRAGERPGALPQRVAIAGPAHCADDGGANLARS